MRLVLAVNAGETDQQQKGLQLHQPQGRAFAEGGCLFAVKKEIGLVGWATRRKPRESERARRRRKRR